MHILIARRDYSDYNWGVWLREAPGLPWSPHSFGRRLESEVDAALDFASKTTPSITFSTRTPEDSTAALVEVPGDLGVIPLNTAVSIFCQEGRYTPPQQDFFCDVTRNPGRTELWSGIGSRFRPQQLRERTKGWFEAERWESFGAPTRHKPHSQPLPYERSLLVRHGEAWKARSICPPDSFPPIKDGPAISPEQQAKFLSKLGQTKSAVRRAKHQAADARFKAEAAARRALEQENAP